jgi:TonB-linked SusC/RagA family outer membrane protein
VAEKHGITLLAGHEFINDDNTSFSGESTGQTDDRLTLLTAGPNGRSVGNAHSQYAYLSWFGRVDYDFGGKYFLNLNVRNDKSSRFGKNNRSAIFYSAGALWNLKGESFLENSELFSDLKLRASYGSSGNSSIGDYVHLATIGTSTYNAQTGWGLSGAGNPDLTWEKQNNLSVSIDATLFQKLNVELEYYNRVTTSMLMDVPYPYTSGFSSVRTNVGKLQNQGIDVTIDYDIYKNKDWKVNVYAALNYNQGKVLELFQGRNQWTVANTGVSYVVGKPVMFYYPLFAGIDPADGSQTWYLPKEGDNSVVTRDPSRTTKVFVATDLEQSTGITRYPPTNGGFGLSASYKGISISSHFAFSLGKYLINNDRYFSSNPYNFAGYNQHREVLDYWKKPGDIATFPRYGQVLQFDDHLLDNASFLRLKTLTLGYTLPKSVLKNTPVFSGVRVFATGRNLLTFTGYEGPDPEVDSNLTYGAYPNSREFTFGLEVSF